MFYPLSVLLRALKALTYKLILVLLCVDECRVLQKKSEIKVQGYSNWSALSDVMKIGMAV
jgi:hypothetical protein